MTSARILVVDDEKGVVNSCVRILERKGYMVIGITDSQAAPALLKEESFDLLLSDIKMPRMDGLELLRLAKEIDPHLTVVLITGYGTMEDAINAIRLGAQGFIMKPFEPEDLIETVKDNLARRALLRDSLRLQTLLPLLEINHILQVSGGQTTLIRRVLDIARHEIGAARVAWLSCYPPFFSLFPFDKRAFLKGHPGQQGSQVVEMAVVPDETMPSNLPPEAIEAAMAEVHSMWVLANGTITTKLEGQTRVVAVLLPLVIDGQVIGLLTAETGQTGRAGSFNQISLDLLAVLAGQLAMMLENIQLFQQTEALRRFNEDIIQNMSNGLVAVDRDGCITAFNPAASHMLGYEAEEVLYQPLLHFIRSTDLEKILKETLTSGSACAHQEITIHHANGAALAVSVSAAPLGSSDMTKPVGVVAVLEDLSEVKALEAERRRLDRLAALGEMSAVVAHEIRNPVAGIAAGVDYLTRNVPKGSPEFEGVQMIQGEIQRVNRILEDILFIARPARLKLSNENLAQVIENVIQRCQAQITENQVTVSTKFVKNLPLLQVDRQRLEQVFTNLVLNATQAMSSGGQLLLQTEVRRSRSGFRTGEVVVTIADTGSGIPVEAQHRIFEPFFTTKTKGTGLGLTVARRIIEEHGGSIRVDSEVARGTRFTIRLPLTEEAAA